MIKSLLLILGAGALLICFAQAETDSDFTLKKIIEEAKTNNPEILAFKSSYEAARTRISGFRYIMDPMFGIEFAGDMRMYSITQQFPFPTKLFALSEFASTEAEQYQTLYLAKKQEVIKNVKKAYAHLFLVYKKIETVMKSMNLLKQLFHSASQNYAVGIASQADMLRGQVELAKAENELLTLKDELKIAGARLNTLLNKPINAELGVPLQLDTAFVTMDIDDLYELARENHPELKAFNLMLDKAKIMVSIARQKYIPDFMFKFTQQEMNYNLMERKLMFGVTVPLWFWGKQNHIVREMNANLEMAKAQYQAMENKVVLAVNEAKVNVDKNRRATALYKKSIIPQAEANLKSALAAYESNQINFLGLLESEIILIQLELDYHQAQANFFVAIADLEEALGIDIQSK